MLDSLSTVQLVLVAFLLTVGFASLLRGLYALLVRAVEERDGYCDPAAPRARVVETPTHAEVAGQAPALEHLGATEASMGRIEPGGAGGAGYVGEQESGYTGTRLGLRK